MADITWPFEPVRDYLPEAFDEAVEFNVAMTVARSGRVTTQSLPGGRWRASMRFPDVPVSQLVQRRQLEAFFMAQRGGADRLLLWNLLTPAPLGTMRGTVTLAANVAAGASTAQIAGGLATPNLLAGGGFEIDTNADGVADSWTAYNNGTVSGITYGRPAGNGTPFAQRITASTLGTTSSDQVGIGRAAFEAVTEGAAYSLSADVICNYATLQVRLHIDWYTAGDVLISSSGAVQTSPLAWQRQSLAGVVAPATAAKAKCYIWMQANSSSSSAPQIYVDNVQFEQAAAPTAYAGLPTLLRGDRIMFGGQRVALTADATATDAGGVTVSFQPAHRAGASSGAAVTLVRPTTRYVLAQPVVQMATRGAVLPGFAVEMVEE